MSVHRGVSASSPFSARRISGGAFTYDTCGPAARPMRTRNRHGSGGSGHHKANQSVHFRLRRAERGRTRRDGKGSRVRIDQATHLLPHRPSRHLHVILCLRRCGGRAPPVSRELHSAATKGPCDVAVGQRGGDADRDDGSCHGGRPWCLMAPPGPWQGRQAGSGAKTMALTADEWGPAAFTTTGACTCAPDASRTPDTRPLLRCTSITSSRNVKAA